MNQRLGSLSPLKFAIRSMSTQARGTVKWFDNVKGFGFIEPEDGGRDLFVHYSQIEGDGYRTLEAGQTVAYVHDDGEKGPSATSVVPI